MPSPQIGTIELRARPGIVTNPCVQGDSFETYNNITTSPNYWVNTWTPMSEGDPKNASAVEYWTISTGGGSGALSGGHAVYDGAQSMGLNISSEDATVTNRNTFLRRTFTGLTPGAVMNVRLYVGVGFHTDSPPATCPLGLRINNGTPVTDATTFGSWFQLTASGTVDGSGNLIVDIGAFGMAGTSGYPLQRIVSFDGLCIRPAG